MSPQPSPAARLLARRLLTATLLGLALVLVASSGRALAAAVPAWTLDSQALPTSFSAADNAHPNCDSGAGWSGCDAYEVTATEAGAAATDGSPVTLTDTLPPGVSVQRIGFVWRGPGAAAFAGGYFNGIDVGTDSSVVDFCTTAPAQCTFPFQLKPDDTLTMTLYVTIDDPAASGPLTNAASITGGAAADASTTAPNSVGGSPASFGVASFSNLIAAPDGTADSQAGSHPYEMTTRIDLNNRFETTPNTSFGQSSSEDPKDVVVDLPLGFLGSALSAPQCTFAQLSSTVFDDTGGCPSDTVVGHILTEPTTQTSLNGPIYNMVPEHGVAAEFAYVDAVAGIHALYARVVPTPAGYVLRTTAPDLPQVPLTDIVTTFFGDPSAKDGGGTTPTALFTNPTDCSAGPLVTTMHMDSWQHPGAFSADGTPDLTDPNWLSATSQSPAVTGCNQLHFSSTLSAQPDTTVADSPAGLNVDIKVPQFEDPSGLATPPLRDASVTLPPGLTVDPSAANGLGACSSAQIGLGSAATPTCPDDSKIGSVQLTTPLLPGVLQGSIYLAKQFDNPFHSLLAGYIVVNDPTTGLVIKIPGNLTPSPLNGQITGVFDNNPQFPFSDLNLTFWGGAHGVLATPQTCGTFTTTADLSPWSAPDSGPDSSTSNTFQTSSGCVRGFHPSMIALSRNPQAGAYSPFVVSLSRSDTDENFEGLSVKLPPGLLAKLAGVQECSGSQLASISSQPGTGAAQATSPSCPANSQVGTVQTGAGVGPDPFFLGGKVYLTGPYKGAPYGLAVVVPAVAGPLDLGTVVVRQALHIDPATAQVTDVSDPFPTILDGIPLRIRRVDVVLNRPQFTVNPTSCDVMNVAGTATSTQGTSAALSSRFQVGGCAGLKFSPKLRMKLTGKGQTRSGDHPTLTSVLTQKSGQANIHNVRVALPLNFALDPNNSQHVCPYTIAQAVTTGPANCPADSLVGHATAVTPLLSQPLSGPVYLVQGIRMQNGVQVHTLPSLLIPLRGQIALDLRAQTSVSGGKLVTTFPTIPDAPVSKFTLTINGGKHGILVITGRGRSICGSPQITQANLIAQNGKAAYPNIKMSTPCRVRRHTKHHSHRHNRRHG